MQKSYSLVLKGGIVFSALIGVIFTMLSDGQSATDGLGSLLYFTQQSNLWLAGIALTMLLCGVLERRQNVAVIQPWMYVAKLAFTVSISLTGLIFCFVLAPASQGAFSPWMKENFFTHVLAPILAILDFFTDVGLHKFGKKQTLFCLAPPLYYFVFSLFCNYARVDFGGGSYYPYFFLNFHSPMGWFGIGGTFPYPFGTFYWVLALLLLVLSLGYLYAWGYNRLQTKRANG